MQVSPFVPALESKIIKFSSNDAAFVLQLQAAILSQPDFRQAVVMLATQLAERLEFERVCIGFVSESHAEVVAISHGATLDIRQESNRRIAAAMDEAIDQAATITFPASHSERPLITLAHAEVAQHNGGAICTVPIVNRGSIVGAITLERGEGKAIAGQEIVLCEHIASLAGPILALQRETERPWHLRACDAFKRLRARLSGPGEMRIKLIAGVGALGLLALFFLPLPYHVSAPARLEGAVQRALVAASDGFVQQVSVRPGDIVKEGQLLAELAGEDLQLERRKRESELAQHENAYGAALAYADRTSQMVNQAKAAEARAQLELVQQQIERARIKSPFDGIVISGDLSQSLGAPIQRGGVLMVVAPRDRYRLIVEVDERDIADISPGTVGRITLAALPGDALAFSTVRIAPVAVTRQGRHFYEVEGKLEAVAPALRPGLEGVARIEAGKRSLAGAFFNRLLVWMRLNLWSWGM